MGIEQPVTAYNAATNVEAHLVKMLLIENGVEAFVAEDLSTGGLWMFGTLPEIHKPQVWISARDLTRAHQVLVDYVAREGQRRQLPRPTDKSTRTLIEVVCDDCGRKSRFPAAQLGTVQNCPHCGAYVDVGEPDDGSEYWAVDAEPNGDENRDDTEDA